MKHKHHIALAIWWSVGASSIITPVQAATVSLDSAPSIQGIFRSVDDKTGFSRGLTEIKIENGEVKGWIIKTIPRPNYTPQKPLYRLSCTIHQQANCRVAGHFGHEGGRR